MAVTTIRLSNKTLKTLEELAKIEKLDRTTLIKKAVEIGVAEIVIEKSIENYRRGKKSAWQAASECGLSLWEFLDQLKLRNIPFKTDEQEIERMLEEF